MDFMILQIIGVFCTTAVVITVLGLVSKHITARRIAASAPLSRDDELHARLERIEQIVDTTAVCGANTWSIVVVLDTTEAWTQCACGLAGLSRLAIGPAAAATTTVSGTRMITDHVIRAEVIWLTLAFSSGSCAVPRGS